MERKGSHPECAAEGLRFIPMTWDADGGAGPSADAAMKAITYGASIGDESFSMRLEALRTEVSMALAMCSGNALALRGPGAPPPLGGVIDDAINVLCARVLSGRPRRQRQPECAATPG